MTLINTL